MERNRRNVIRRNKGRKGFEVGEGGKIMKIRGKWEIWRRTQEKKVISVERR
jgi:hypothetical protein